MHILGVTAKTNFKFWFGSPCIWSRNKRRQFVSTKFQIREWNFRKSKHKEQFVPKKFESMERRRFTSAGNFTTKQWFIPAEFQINKWNFTWRKWILSRKSEQLIFEEFQSISIGPNWKSPAQNFAEQCWIIFENIQKKQWNISTDFKSPGVVPKYTGCPTYLWPF